MTLTLQHACAGLHAAIAGGWLCAVRDSEATGANLLAQLQYLPWFIHVSVALAMLAGLVLWSCGRHVLKPTAVCLSVTLCSLTGAVVLPAIFASDAPALIGAVGGAAVGLIAALLLYRLALAAGFSLIAGAGAGLIAATLLSGPDPARSLANGLSSTIPPGAPIPVHAPEPPVADEGPMSEDPPAIEIFVHMQGPMDDAVRLVAEPPPPAAGHDRSGGVLSADALRQQIASAAERARRFAVAALDHARARWHASSVTHRAIFAVAVFVGMIFGFIAGWVLPGWAAGVMTSLAGAGVWLPAWVWLSLGLDLPWVGYLDLSNAGWLFVYASVTAVGVAAQWTGLLLSKNNAKSKSPPR